MVDLNENQNEEFDSSDPSTQMVYSFLIMAKVSQYQKDLHAALRNRFSDVKLEWRAFENTDEHTYGPRVDIAIGPFNIDDKKPRRLESRYNTLSRKKKVKQFLKLCHDYHLQNIEKIYTNITPSSFQECLEGNANGRCFLTIEIENMNSRKHLMGSMSMLPRWVGLGLA
jgi:phage gp46-like protein